MKSSSYEESNERRYLSATCCLSNIPDSIENKHERSKLAISNL